ncbi:hypothetical protein [Methylocystis sp. SB2]|nr:hypothetical protein [Methylocystis sp. SB2]
MHMPPPAQIYLELGALHMNPYETILTRIPASAPSLVRETVEVVGRLVDRFREEVATIRRDASLSPVGRTEKIRARFDGGYREHYSQLRGTADRALAGITAEIGGMRKRAVEMLSEGSTPALRHEVRQFLLSRDANERRRLAFKTEDRLMQAAILEAPAFLSGVDAEAYAVVEQKVVEGAFGQRLGELKVNHDGWQNADAALKVAEGQLSREFEIATFGVAAE